MTDPSQDAVDQIPAAADTTCSERSRVRCAGSWMAGPFPTAPPEPGVILSDRRLSGDYCVGVGTY
jgi:hypothetical protein